VWVGLSSIAAGLAPTFPLLVIFRALGGVGSACSSLRCCRSCSARSRPNAPAG
jgi:hypothetical protein